MQQQMKSRQDVAPPKLLRQQHNIATVHAAGTRVTSGRHAQRRSDWWQSWPSEGDVKRMLCGTTGNMHNMRPYGYQVK
jgi:hypothetical protein